MSVDDARGAHLIGKALAIALEVMSRAHQRHQPGSDMEDMAEIYLSSYPDEIERAVHAHSVRWLLAGGLDLRERPFEPLAAFATAPPPEPSPGGGERLVA